MFIENNKLTIKRKLLVGASAATLLASFSSGFVAQAQAPEFEGAASITIDYDSGQILQGKAIDEPLGIASMTKMLVEYIVFEEIEAGNINWDTEVKISDYAYNISQNYALSNVPLRNGEFYSLLELYDAMAIYSANGATIAIAEAISGSESAFVDRMITTVESFGIEDAKLYNSTGLNNRYLEGNIYPDSAEDAENMMSARSVAKISNRILRDYPEILETASIPKQVFREGTVDAIDMVNWNWMLEGLLLERPGVDGLKTGTTDFAGATFTGTATEGDRRLITVIMDSGDDLSTRFRETGKMLDYGFDKFAPEVVTTNWEDSLEYQPLTVTRGKEEQLDYIVGEELEMLIQLGDNLEEELVYTIEWDENIVTADGSIEAPIAEGMELGHLKISYAGNDYGYLEDEKEASVPLVAKNSVEKAGFFKLAWNGTVNFFKGLLDRF